TTNSCSRSTGRSLDPEDWSMFHVKRGGVGRWSRPAAFFVTFALLLAGLTPASPRPAAASVVATAPFAPGFVLAHRRPGVSTASLTAQAGVSGIVATIPSIGVEKLAVAPGQEGA